MQRTPIIAVFIDADNIQSHNVKKIMDVLSSKGNVMIRRVYANWAKSDEYLTGWSSAIAEHGFKAIQQFDHVQGKNASDMAMIVDVMDFLYTKDVDIFCLVSSDSDFTPLCLRLREMGKFIIGMGNKNTSKSLINACHDFHYLNFNQLKSSEPPSPAPSEPPKPPKTDKGESTKPTYKKSGNPNHNKELIELVHRWVAKESRDGWLIASTLGQLLQKHGYFYQNFGFDKLATFMKALKDFDVKFEGSNYYIGEKSDHNLSMQMIEAYATDDELVSVHDVQVMVVDNALINAIGSAVAVHQVDGWADVYAVTDYLKGTFGITSEQYGYTNLLELLKNITTFETQKVEKRYFIKDLRATLSDEPLEVATSSTQKHKYTTEELQDEIELMALIAKAIDDNLSIGSWATTVDVGQALKQQGVSAKDYGYKNIGLLLKASELFEIIVKDDGQTHVKSPTGKTAKPKESAEVLEVDNLQPLAGQVEPDDECVNETNMADESADDPAEAGLATDEFVEAGDNQDGEQDDQDDEVETIDGHEFLAVLNQAINKRQNQDGWANVTNVGADIKKAFGVGSMALGYRTFAEFFATLDGYELKKVGRIWHIRQKLA